MQTEYRATSLKGSAPIVFRIWVDDEEFHDFRVPRKMRADIAQYAALAVRLVNGERVIDHPAVRNALITFVAREVWQPETTTEGDEPSTTPGEWVRVDDAERLVDLFNSPRISLDGDVLAQLLMDLVEATGSHPTGASKPS